MAGEDCEGITLEEFDRRLEASTERLAREAAETQERIVRLEALLARKEAFARRLDQMLAEIEHEETEIAALERGVRAGRATPKRQRPTTRILK